MARIDDYFNAKKIAAESLYKDKFDDIIDRTAFKALDENKILIPFLNRVYYVIYKDFEFKDNINPEKEVPIQEQVLILHYMIGHSKRQILNKFVAYREIKGASFYFSAFAKRAIDPLKNTFGNNIDGFSKASNALMGKAIGVGDAGFEFNVFPYVPLQIIIWSGDEEFPPEANILFDESIGQILSPEDIAWLSGMIVYRLIALSKS